MVTPDARFRATAPWWPSRSRPVRSRWVCSPWTHRGSGDLTEDDVELVRVLANLLGAAQAQL